jgi:putative sterol carrier protein
MLKATSEDIKIELRALAHKLEEGHREKLTKISPPILVAIELPHSFDKVLFLVGEGKIKEVHQEDLSDSKIYLGYREFKKLLEKPQKILQYLASGRVRIKGDLRRVLSSLEVLSE